MYEKKYTVGLDLGTSSVKGVLFDGEKALFSESAKFDYKDCSMNGAPYTGFDADEFCKTVFGVIERLAANVSGGICGIAVASASGNTLLLQAGKPLCSAYSWINSAFSAEVDALFSEEECKELSEKSGWNFFKTFPVAHIAHVKAHAPELLERADTVCMTTEYLLWKMTGKWGADLSTATPSYLLNQTEGKYCEKTLDRLGIKDKFLPPLGRTGDFLGYVTEGALNEMNLQAGVKVFLGSFDHPSGARANGVTREGDLLLSCGTSWVGFFPCRNRDYIIKSGYLCDPFMFDQGLWGAMFSFAQVSEKIDLILKKHVPEAAADAKTFDKLSERAAPGCGGLKINPVTDYEGDFIGFGKEDICRAVMEGMAHTVREKLAELSKDGMNFNRIVMAGGPSNSDIWRKILGEVCGREIETRYKSSSGAVGAAMLAFNGQTEI